MPQTGFWLCVLAAVQTQAETAFPKWTANLKEHKKKKGETDMPVHHTLKRQGKYFWSEQPKVLRSQYGELYLQVFFHLKKPQPNN